MAKSGLQFQPKGDRADPSYPFPSRFGENGEIIYSVPAEISSASAFATFGISMADCSTLPFGDKQKLVYYIETTDRKFAFDQKKWLNNMHTTERRYNYRNTSFEKKFETEEDGIVTHTDHPLLAKEEEGYEQAEADDLRDRMIEYVREKFPKNGLYADVLALYLKKGYGTRKIGEELNIRERSARFFLDKAKEKAGEYYRRYGK